MGADIGELTRDTIPTDVLEADRPVIIDVWGPQCVPCIALSPTFERLAGEFGDRARFMKLEAPKNRMACVDLKVMGLPAFLRYEGGAEVSRLTGDVDDAALVQWVKEALANEGGDEE